MIQWLKDQLEEWFLGFILGLGFFWAIGWWAVLLGVVTGVLYRLGGMGLWGTKIWRRLGIPVLVVAWVHTSVLLTGIIAGLITFGLLSIGYGQRSTQPPDEGSPLGNWWLDRLGEKWGKWASRATIIGAIWISWGVAYGLSQGR